MRSALRQWCLIVSFINILLSTLCHSLPHSVPAPQSLSPPTKRNLLLRRDDDPFLGEDWAIALMENQAAFVPHNQAAAALSDFYTSLLTIAQNPPTLPHQWLTHRIGRVMIIMHCDQIPLPWDLIVRFAQKMLDFTHRGYTSSYRMVFRHELYGYTITAVLSILDRDPENREGGECVVEEHGQINRSGIQQHQVCMRPPTVPGQGASGSGP